MPTLRTVFAVFAVAGLLSACGDDDDAGGGEDTTTTSGASTTTTSPAELEQPAIWPAAGVVFDTPAAAAEDFVTSALGVPPTLGEFQQGDARSGEIEVFSPGEGPSATPVVRGVLLMRQLGPDEGWFVIAATSDHQTITAPSSGDQVTAGPLVVEGSGRGFEGTIVVTAFRAGEAEPELDELVTQGGAQEASEPFTVTLDLSDASPGETVALLVRGGTGLETDPGDFAAIPVAIAN